MKRFAGLLLIIALFMILVPANAEDVHESGDFLYEIKSNGSATIAGYTGEQADIILPATIDGYTITAIGDEAFACEEKAGEAITITIPETVTSIGEKAFWNRNVRMINLPDKLETIGYGAFVGCNACKFRMSANHPRFSVIDDALYDKAKRELIWTADLSGRTLSVPEGILSIGDYACYDSHIEGNLALPQTLERIGDYAFQNSVISELSIPASVSSIGTGAFLNCSDNGANAEIHIDENNVLAEIAESAFDGGHITIHFPDTGSLNSIVSLGEYAFRGATLDGGIAISEGCKIIPRGAFEATSGLEVSIEEGVEVIEEDAFTGSGLTTVYLPDTLNMISANAFDEVVEFVVEKDSYAENWAIENARMYSIEGEEVDYRWLTGADQPVAVNLGETIQTDAFELRLDMIEIANSVELLDFNSAYTSVDSIPNGFMFWSTGAEAHEPGFFEGLGIVLTPQHSDSKFVYLKGQVSLLQPDITNRNIHDYICAEIVFDDRQTVEAEVCTGFVIEKENNAGGEIDLLADNAREFTVWLLAEAHSDLLENSEEIAMRIGVLDEYTASDSVSSISLDNCDALYDVDLNAATSESTAVAFEALQIGSRGDAVVSLQKKLIDLGFLSGNADGIYGNATAEGVRQFQESEDLPETGEADAATQERLYSK